MIVALELLPEAATELLPEAATDLLPKVATLRQRVLAAGCTQT